jgi:hypothetical protein
MPLAGVSDTRSEKRKTPGAIDAEAAARQTGPQRCPMTLGLVLAVACSLPSFFADEQLPEGFVDVSPRKGAPGYVVDFFAGARKYRLDRLRRVDDDLKATKEELPRTKRSTKLKGKAKLAAIADAESRITKLERDRKNLLSNASVPIPELDKTRLTPGLIFRHQYKLHVDQLIDKKGVVARIFIDGTRDDTIFLEIDTTDLTENDKLLRVPGAMVVIEKKDFTTILGVSRVMYLVRQFDPEEWVEEN